MIAIYLNDHLAGATAAVELARRARGSAEDGELGGFLASLADEIDEDRATLEGLMARLDVGVDRVKQAGAWTAEKLGRLKLNGRLLGRSPLTPMVELEALAIGVDAKAALWRMLRTLDDPRLQDVDFDALLVRAERQHDQIERHRLAVGRTALRAGD